ncbi:MAG: hypothetical protein Q8P73_05175 [bacterium]|nr:hypothetical protein [bacterium]
MNITIIGAGEIGQALAGVLTQNPDNTISLWDKADGKVSDQKPLEQIIPNAQIIFMCVPSRAMRAAAKETSAHLPAETAIISIAKGIEKDTLATMDEVLTAELPNNPIALLGGPLIAEEISQGQTGVGLLASADKNALKNIPPIFSGTSIAIATTNDIHGVALAGVLKNVYAISLGAATILSPGLNFRGWLVQQACAEMSVIIPQLGGQTATAYTAAGLGDLIATGFSPDSSNHQTGRDLAEKGTTERQSEGYVSLRQVLDLIGDRQNRLPLLTAMKAIIIDQKNAREVYDRLPVG